MKKQVTHQAKVSFNQSSDGKSVDISFPNHEYATIYDSALDYRDDKAGKASLSCLVTAEQAASFVEVVFHKPTSKWMVTFKRRSSKPKGFVNLPSQYYTDLKDCEAAVKYWASKRFRMVILS